MSRLVERSSSAPVTATPVNRSRLRRRLKSEIVLFERTHPRSRALFRQARRSMLAGVPMNWMTRWAGPFPIFVRQARGGSLVDVDGRRYVDLCLGDTGAMFGHSPPAFVEALRRRLSRGITTMLPTQDAIWVAEELRRRFHLPYWQITTSATDANRFALRVAREVTRRRKVVVFNGCYHGTVDESLVRRTGNHTVAVEGNIGPPVDPSVTTRAIEFNDVSALERALAPRDVAAVLAEPAMTNQGIILPDPGYHHHLRELTRRYGSLLVLDETHTICAGPSGYSGLHGLTSDFLTLGKPIAGGLPAGAFGMAADVMDSALPKAGGEEADESGLGGTLAGSPLQLGAMRAVLGRVITEAAYRRSIPLATRWTDGAVEAIERHGLPWHVTQLGARAEYRFRATPPRNGAEALAARDPEVDRYTHLFALNRGFLLAPFHNMALFAPNLSLSAVDEHGAMFDEMAASLRTD